MVADFIKGYPSWFAMNWDAPAVVGHRCGWNVFRVTELSQPKCGCGLRIPDLVR